MLDFVITWCYHSINIINKNKTMIISKALTELNNIRADILSQVEAYDFTDEHCNQDWDSATEKALEDFDPSDYIYCEEGDEEFEQAKGQFTALVTNVF
mgnify:CR=1 FL=1